MKTTTNDEGDTFEPYQDPDSLALGFKVTRATDGHVNGGMVEYIVLNPSGDRDDDGYPTVFLYVGATGDPSRDQACHFYDMFDGFAPHPEGV